MSIVFEPTIADVVDLLGQIEANDPFMGAPSTDTQLRKRDALVLCLVQAVMVLNGDAAIEADAETYHKCAVAKVNLGPDVSWFFPRVQWFLGVGNPHFSAHWMVGKTLDTYMREQYEKCHRFIKAVADGDITGPDMPIGDVLGVSLVSSVKEVE